MSAKNEMSCLSELEPQQVFQYFEELNKIPRGTGNSEKISSYLVAFAKENNLEYIRDEVNNVIIKKPGSSGYENLEPIILQGHMDMVCEKKPGSNHDFTKDSIEMYIENGFVRAKDTTLGADNGIAIAYMMAILSDNTIKHPPLEVLCTTDEEVGMTGANAIDLSVLKGSKLINLDTDEEGTLTVGCAGGFRGSIFIPIERTSAEGTLVKLEISGLCGGHSGGDIHLQRGNANKLMGRFLNDLRQESNYFLVDWNGGTADNVIPSFCIVNIVIPTKELIILDKYIEKTISEWALEFNLDEPNLKINQSRENEASTSVFTSKTTEKLIFLITGIRDGVYCFSRQLDSVVETSMNLGMVMTQSGEVELWFMGRSLLESKKNELMNMLRMFAKEASVSIAITNDYPCWTYRTESLFKQCVIHCFEKYYHKKPLITTVHAGLECGILCSRKAELDCISFGPIIYDIHSTNERLDIASTKRTYEFLIDILSACK